MPQRGGRAERAAPPRVGKELLVLSSEKDRLLHSTWREREERSLDPPRGGR